MGLGPLPLCPGSPLASVGGRAPEGSVLTPKAPPGTADTLAKAEGRLQKRLGQEPAPLMVQLDVVQQVPAQDSLALLPGRAVSARASFVVLRNGFLKRQAVWERRGHPATLPPSSWAPSAPASCRDARLGPCGFLPGEHKSGDTCQPQAVRPGGPLRQHLVWLNPERQRGLAKASHLPRSRLASTPGHSVPSPESPLLRSSHCAHECPGKKKKRENG